jgi:NAD(P)H-nitrite reductase large subunit
MCDNCKENPEVCLCFHVHLSKLVKFHRLHKPRVASQMSECYGAGTGCGWCVPYLERLHEQLERGEQPDLATMDQEEYQQLRQEYHHGLRDKTQEANRFRKK